MSAEAPTFERVTDDSVSGILSDVQAHYEGGSQAAVEAPAQAPEAAPEPNAPQVEPPPTVPPVEPVEQPVEEPPAAATEEDSLEIITPPESRLAPLFDLTSLPPEQALPQALTIMQSIHQHDPIAYTLLANAVLQASPQAARTLVLEQAGIAPEKISQFTEWLAKGGDALPEPITYPAFEQLVQKLPDSPEGEEWVRLQNGLELNLLDQRDKAHFELEKRLYDADVKDKVAEREQAIVAQRAEDERKQNEALAAQQALSERVDFYTEGRYGVANSIVDPIVKALAPEDKFRGDMLKAYARTFIDTHEEVLAIGKQAANYVKDGHGFAKDPLTGQWKMTGRAAEFASRQDAIIKRELNSLIDKFNKDLLRTNRAELAATATQPVVSQGVKEIVSTAPAIPGQSLETYEDIIAAAREEDRRRAGAGN